VFDGLQPGNYFILPPPEGYSACSQSSGSVLGQFPRPIPVSVGTGINELHDVLIPRSDLVTITGLLQLDKEWAGSHTAAVNDIGIAVRCPKNDMRSNEVICDGTISKEGQFSVRVQRGEKGALLQLSYGPEIVLLPIDVRDASEQHSMGVVDFPK
jgi:hypothetical protein